jgi:hypothetical protein
MVKICFAIAYILFIFLIVTLCYYLGYLMGKRAGEEQALIDRLSEQGEIDKLAEAFQRTYSVTYDEIKEALERIKQGE